MTLHNFKKGDILIVVDDSGIADPFQKGDKVTVFDVKGLYVSLKEHLGWWLGTRFKLHDSILEAKKLLEENGWTLTPPRTPLTGEVVVYNYRGKPAATTKEIYARFERKENFPQIAVIKWIEGDGLE